MAGDGVRIRDLRPEDVDRIGEIAVAAWEPAYEHYRENMGEELFSAAYGDWRAYKSSQVESNCLEAPDDVLVATLDGDVVGFVTFRIDDDTGIGEIGNNAVHPDAQGGGIATELYERTLDVFRDRGAEFAQVSTGLTPEYAPARRAYEKVGFDIERPTVTYYQYL